LTFVQDCVISRMTELDTPPNAKTPWHLWAVGIPAVIWNAIGVMDFTMTVTRNSAYMSAFSEEQLNYFYSFPLWLLVVWGIAVIGAELGSLLLLLRQKLACKVFLISFVATCITMLHNYLFTNGYAIMGGIGAVIFSVVIFVIALLLLIYAKKLTKAGLLR